MTTGIYLQVVGRTDVGNVRENNEDTFVVADLTGQTLLGAEGSNGRFEIGDRGVLLAVSDGMGGLRAGEVASALVAETLPRAMLDVRPSAPSQTKLEDAVARTNETVWANAQERGVRMGATLTAVYVHGSAAWIAEVGDSRAYLVRAGRITQLTKDQSVVQQLIDAGAVAPKAAAKSPYRSIVLQAMGHDKDVKVALGRLELRAFDCLVLCSDGLTAHLSDDDIRTIVLSSRDLQTACDSLVYLANARGGYDNITVVLGGVSGALSVPAAVPGGDSVEETFRVVKSFA
jgi:serine/threonine protein phosphatase PrpC